MKSENGPLAGFFALVLFISIPFWALGSLYPVQILPGLPASALGAFAPAFAAGIMVYRRGHLAAVARLLRRTYDLGRIRNKLWFLVFMLFNPAVAFLAFWIMRALGRRIPQPSLMPYDIVLMFVFFLIGALGEELGWTGYATEDLYQRWGIFRAGIILGLAWVVFHLVGLTQVHRSMGWIAWWALGTISLRIFMVWLYQHAGKSVLAAAIFHAMINLSWQLFPINGSFYDPMIFSLTALGLAAAVMAGKCLMPHGLVVID
jgi:membrane protease YdiL (CAAX protease family)